MSFVQRKIDLTFQLNNGAKFACTSSDTVTVSGLRVSVAITKAGGAGMSNAVIRVYGLSDTLMQQLSTYGAPANIGTAATVQVSAGDSIVGKPIVFIGNIQNAAADYNQMPDVAFSITAFTGLIHSLRPTAPTSISGSADAGQIMGALAQKMGLTFENNGVNVKLDCPYFPGTARMQAQDCAEAGDFNWVIDNGTLAIWPKNGFRSGDPILVSPDAGMVGYPTFILYGIVVRSLLNAAIQYGTRINVQSSLKPATGIWAINQMVYELESETVNGAWFMTMTALDTNFVGRVNASVDAG